MRAIPKKMLETILADPYYKKCAREGPDCSGRITLEHAFIYGGKQINEVWAIIPLCEYHHLGKGLVKTENEFIALKRATKKDLAKYPKRDWAQRKKYLEAQHEKRAKQKTAADSAYVTRTEPFAAKIIIGTDGRKQIKLNSPVWYHHQLNKFKGGESVTLEVHSKKPKRTQAQNAYYWGVYLPVIAAETGESDLDALHTLFKGKFLSEGIVEVLGQKVRKTKSTTELGVGEFCQYILDIEAETQIAAPPTENYGLAPLSTGRNEK